MERSLVEARLGRAIDDAVAAPCVRALVAAYYDPDGPFAGATFDGVARTPEDTVVIEDLLAVTALNVRWSPLTVRRLLEPGVTSGTVNALLAGVPATVPLWPADDAHTTAVRALRGELLRLPDVGWVSAYKLAARKRPLIVPVYDSVVRTWLGAPAVLLEPLAAALRDDRRRARIDRLGDGLPGPRPSTLRLLDVAVWMQRSNGTAARSARRRLCAGPEPHPVPGSAGPPDPTARG